MPSDEVQRTALMERVESLQVAARALDSQEAAAAFSSEATQLVADVLAFTGAGRLSGMAERALFGIQRWPENWEARTRFRNEVRALFAEIPPGADLQPFSQRLRELGRRRSDDRFGVESLVTGLVELLEKKPEMKRSNFQPVRRQRQSEELISSLIGSTPGSWPVALLPGDPARGDALARDVRTLGKAHRLVYEVEDSGAFAAAFARQLQHLAGEIYASAGFDAIPAAALKTLAAAERWFGSGIALAYGREAEAIHTYCQLVEVSDGWQESLRERRARLAALKERYPNLHDCRLEVDQLLADWFRLVRARRFAGSHA